MIKSIIAIILSWGILFNSIGNIMIFSIYQNSVRKEIRKHLKSDKSEKRIEILKFAKSDIKNGLIRFVKYDEFIYNNQLYDIKRSKTEGDSIYYYCINDTKEKDLMDKFSSDWEKKSENPSKSNPAKILSPKTLEYLIYYYSIDKNDNKINFCDDYVVFYSSFICEPVSPPPKII
ncbi:MAG: hypothetical protein N2319_12610 [Candidatus Kapabacteria bacterium]|nr:hypothetical protein [Candidatus Kapabacteria bacterium]